MLLEQRRWAFLAYMVADHKGSGDTTLDKEVMNEIRAIWNAADPTQMHVAIQVDFKKRPGIFRATRTQLPAKLDQLPPDLNQYPIDSAFACATSDFVPVAMDPWEAICRQVDSSDPVFQKTREANSASVGALRGFLGWATTACPAEYYALLFWGHSNGPRGLFFDRDPGKAKRDPRVLSLPGVQKALRHDPAMVVLFRDCCMSTLETVYQLQDAARYAIASQAIVPILGSWPYQQMFATMQSDAPPDDVVRELAVMLGTHHDDAQNRRTPTGKNLSQVPITLLDIDAGRKATDLLSELVRVLKKVRHDRQIFHKVQKAFERARRGDPHDAVKPGDPALIDVLAFCGAILQMDVTPLKDAADKLARLLRQELIKVHHSQDVPLNNTFLGVSVYYKPLSGAAGQAQQLASFIEPVEPFLYRGLQVSHSTQWHRIALTPFDGVAAGPLTNRRKHVVGHPQQLQPRRVTMPPKKQFKELGFGSKTVKALGSAVKNARKASKRLASELKAAEQKLKKLTKKSSKGK